MTEIATLTMNPTIDRSASIDRVLPEKKLRCQEERFDPGGGGINVAMAITNLGGQATAIYTGGGRVGEHLHSLLDSRGLRHRAITIAQNTRENVIIHERQSEHQYRFGMPGPEISQPEQQTCLEIIAGLDPAPEYLVLSGSLPPGVPDDFYGRIVQAAPASSRIVLDTAGQALREGVKQSVFLLKPNQRELSQLAGHEIENDGDARDAAMRLIDQGKVQIVMVSLGRGGIMMVSADQHQRVAAPTVPIRSKIGAGDSTVAGTVLALRRGDSLIDAVRFGVACGTAAVMTEGTELCRREDAERLYREIIDEANPDH